eukprot:3017014-Amphidinium_carterae.1
MTRYEVNRDDFQPPARPAPAVSSQCVYGQLSFSIGLGASGTSQTRVATPCGDAIGLRSSAVEANTAETIATPPTRASS